MTSQCLFKLMAVFHPAEFLAGRTVSLPRSINEFSLLRDIPWTVRPPEDSSLSNEGALSHQLYKSVEQGLSCSAYRVDELPWIRERVVFRPNAELNLQEFEIEILLDYEDQEEAFCNFSDQLKFSDLN